MKRSHHVIDQQDKEAERELGKFCRANGPLRLPLVELIEQARLPSYHIVCDWPEPLGFAVNLLSIFSGLLAR